MNKEFVISTDLGGTKILSALINKENKIIERSKLATDSNKGPDFIVECIAKSVKSLLKKTGIDQKEVRALSLGVPGTVNPESGIISIAPNLNIKNYNIKKALQKYFEIPVLLENDVNLGGLGVKYFEYKNKVKNMLVVFVGTGIGGALIFNGKLYRGSSFFAGEIGHMKVNFDGSLNAGDSKETFESLASRTAIVNSIVVKSKKNDTVLKKTIKKGERIKSKTLSKAITEKDKLVIEEMTKGCKIIGTVLGSLTTLLNFDTIVLGGGAIEANEEFMMTRIKKAFFEAVIEPAGKIAKVTATKLGDDAAIYGGIALADEFLPNE
ncbi:MAG: ROK family protein [Ignavibacteriae bacterium]|nr:ROK family protein [Ignavibacteriota bacterium]MCB9209092.1 ROK family protein [Ignavibacteriales bacterium]MCB9217987.1 ROK family protein [Ignavibacteriales bacterium]MCB9260376.1 ROK family protein [Ignavibacteriales bacterium]